MIRRETLDRVRYLVEAKLVSLVGAETEDVQNADTVFFGSIPDWLLAERLTRLKEWLSNQEPRRFSGMWYLLTADEPPQIDHESCVLVVEVADVEAAKIDLARAFTRRPLGMAQALVEARRRWGIGGWVWAKKDLAESGLVEELKVVGVHLNDRKPAQEDEEKISFGSGSTWSEALDNATVLRFVYADFNATVDHSSRFAIRLFPQHLAKLKTSVHVGERLLLSDGDVKVEAVTEAAGDGLIAVADNATWADVTT